MVCTKVVTTPAMAWRSPPGPAMSLHILWQLGNFEDAEFVIIGNRAGTAVKESNAIRVWVRLPHSGQMVSHFPSLRRIADEHLVASANLDLLRPVVTHKSAEPRATSEEGPRYGGPRSRPAHRPFRPTALCRGFDSCNAHEGISSNP
jgi:hypothetical protein